MRFRLLGLFLALGLVVPAAALAADGDGSKAKEKTVKAQTTCPLMGGKINKKIFADHDGKRVYFCCAGCIAGFKKDPAKYVKKLEDAGVTLEKVCKACSGVKGSAECKKACEAKKTGAKTSSAATKGKCCP